MTATAAQVAAAKAGINTALTAVNGMAAGSTVTAAKTALTAALTDVGKIQVVTPPPPPPVNPVKVTSALTFTGVGSTAAPFTASLRATSSAGVISWIFPNWNILPAGWSWSGNLDIVCTAPGSLDVPGVIVEDTAGNKVTVEVKVTVTAPVVPPPPPPPPPPSGMAIGVSLGFAQALWGTADHGAAQYAAMHADGFHGVRIDCPMDNPGTNDATIRAAIAAGLDVLLILDGYQTQNGPAAFAAFAQATVKEYAPLGVHHYELLNEPGSATNWDTQDNFVNPSAYAALCKQAYTAIKAVDPAAVVVLGGNSVFQSSNGAGPDTNGNYVGSILPATFLTAVYAANGGTTAGLCDAIGMHPYCDPNLPSTGNNWGVFLNPVGTAGFYGDSVFAVMSAHGEAKKPVWITEFGFQTASVQAAGFTAALNMAMAGPATVAAFYCFNWSDDGDGAYGLNTSAYAPKPALAAVEKFLQGTVTPPPPPPPSGAGAITFLGYSDYAGAAEQEAFVKSYGADPKTTMLMDFADAGNIGSSSTWASMFSAPGGMAADGTWPNPAGWVFALGMQAGVTPRLWTDVISGSLDAEFNGIIKQGVGWNVTIWRLGWEFNGSWFSWGIGGNDTAANQAGFKAAFRHIALLIRAQQPKAKIMFNPTSGNSAELDDWTAYYPGDDVVDIVGTDIYNNHWNNWPGDAAEEAILISSGPSPTLNDIVAFAKAHGKAVAIPEFGCWDPASGPNESNSPGDDPTFINAIFTWLLPLIQGGLKVYLGPWSQELAQFPNSMAMLKSWYLKLQGLGLVASS